MVDALGDTGHSRFLSPRMVEEMAAIERNKFQGIGAEVQSKDGHVVIVAPMDGSRHNEQVSSRATLFCKSTARTSPASL